MKTGASKTHSANKNSNSTRPFFSKSGAEAFPSTPKEVEHQFFSPAIQMKCAACKREGDEQTSLGLQRVEEKEEGSPLQANLDIQKQDDDARPRDPGAVARARSMLRILEPQLSRLEGRRLEIEADRLRVLADRASLDDNAGDPTPVPRQQVEDRLIASMNRLPLDIQITSREVRFRVRFHVRFDDPGMESRFGELQRHIQAGIRTTWNQTLSGAAFQGRTFSIDPSVTLIRSNATRDHNFWLIVVRAQNTGQPTYPGCTIPQLPTGAPTSVTESTCDGGVMFIPPSHITNASVLGHEIMHLFGLVDRYALLTHMVPGQSPVVSTEPTRNTPGRRDPLGGETGTILREDLGYLFDRLGVYSQESTRSTSGLALLRLRVDRLREVVRLGYDPNSLIRTRRDFIDEMVRDAEDL